MEPQSLPVPHPQRALGPWRGEVGCGDMCVVGTWGRVGRGDVGRGTWQAACCRHEVASEGASLRAVLGKGAGLSAAWDISA